MSLAHASESVCGRPSISPRTHSELMRCGEDAIEVSTVKRRRITYEPPETTFGGSRGHGRPYADDVTNQAWASASWPNTTDTLRHGIASETGTPQSSRPAMSFGLAPELSLGLRHQYTASQTAEWNETTLEKTQPCSPPISQGFSQPRSKPSDPVCDFDTQTLELSCGLGLGQSSQNISQTTEIIDLRIELVQRWPKPSATRLPAQYLPPSHVTADGNILGELDARSSQVLQALHEDVDIAMQLALKVSNTSMADRSKAPSLERRESPSLSVILYGPDWLADDIASYLQDCDIYLQEPHGCDRNVVYCNPHCLSASEGEVRMTCELSSPRANMAISRVVHSDTLDTLISARPLQEIDSPVALRTQLLPHQRQALYFMTQRELGWNLTNNSYDIWTEVRGLGQTVDYQNNITSEIQSYRPESFKGGILADSMGLGKSCSVIALLVYDLESAGSSMGTYTSDTTITEAYEVNTTLLIVPPALLQMWEEQLQEHLCNVNSLGVRRHHGTSRVSTIEEAEKHLLIITTYQTVESEWRSRSVVEPSLLFSVHWRRIVLDEAHYVSNYQSSTFTAICSLKAQARWAVTGTPLQNRLGDIATMCQFLRVYPYGDRKAFHRDIIAPWKSGHHQVAVFRLRAILQSILLRRSQGSIQLPTRTDLRFTLQLSLQEREYYSVVESNVARSIDKALHGVAQSPKMFANIIQQINELRLICNLGIHRKPPKAETYINNNLWDAPTAQRAMHALIATESPICKSCGLTLDSMGLNSDLGMELTFASFRVWLFSCLAIICERCVKQRSNTGCHCTFRCPSAMVTCTPGRTESGVSSPAGNESDVEEDELPTKINALVADLLEQPPGTKSIVFTFWSSTLDLMVKGLTQASIVHTRYDGNTSRANRSLALKNFRQNPDISVILMTISCAAVGLDITAASRAYILEPQWNPTIEEQALARVHRMGQTKDVTTIRFVMADTFEERVVETQERKKELAELLLSPEQHAESEHSLDRLRYFRSLLK